MDEREMRGNTGEESEERDQRTEDEPDVEAHQLSTEAPGQTSTGEPQRPAVE